MNNKIIILASVIIISTIVGFSITQIVPVEEKEVSYLEEKITYLEESDEISSVLEKIKDDKIRNDNSEDPYIPKEREWIQSGLFFIDRSEYILGEKIFINIENIDENTKGTMLFSKIINSTTNKLYKKITFDGEFSQRNFYLSVYPTISAGFCTADELVGEWTVDFIGTDNESFKFRIIDRIMPGMERVFKPVC